MSQLALSKFQLARHDAEDAILFDSKKVEYYRILCQSLMALSLFSEAKEVCEMGLNVDPLDDVLTRRLRDARAMIAVQKYDVKILADNGLTRITLENFKTRLENIFKFKGEFPSEVPCCSLS